MEVEKFLDWLQTYGVLAAIGVAVLWFAYKAASDSYAGLRHVITTYVPELKDAALDTMETLKANSATNTEINQANSTTLNRMEADHHKYYIVVLEGLKAIRVALDHIGQKDLVNKVGPHLAEIEKIVVR
jgi:hypothetical protein